MIAAPAIASAVAAAAAGGAWQCPPGDCGLGFVWWVYLIILVVLAAVSYALAPKPKTPKPPAVQSLDVPTAEDGRPISVVFGTCWIDDANVINYGNLRTAPIYAHDNDGGGWYHVPGSVDGRLPPPGSGPPPGIIIE